MRKARPLPVCDHVLSPVSQPEARRANWWPAILMAIGLAGLAVPAASPPTPRLIWNASASAPVGLYAVSPPARLRRGDMAFAFAPPPARELAASRHYLPRNVPLLKRVAAMEGDEICARDLGVSINGRPVAVRRETDRLGRPLPAWQGCVRLGRNDLFLLMTDSPDSFDGRYFGVSERQQIVGRATALWLP
ncbi:S26 family signal peptidase [Sandaracinobacteroides hominis]|uniref:S26 family signal peptidase n=1 Tax=Sandaracinobacteroides hominis TaxID=2780086 RepID=UPI0018F374D2|nr:S26 family signal peptidase [Sandaracinobacteroides hominis]